MPAELDFSDDEEFDSFLIENTKVTSVKITEPVSKNNMLWSTAKKLERWIILEPKKGMFYEGCIKPKPEQPKNIRLASTME